MLSINQFNTYFYYLNTILEDNVNSISYNKSKENKYTLNKVTNNLIMLYNNIFNSNKNLDLNVKNKKSNFSNNSNYSNNKLLNNQQTIEIKPFLKSVKECNELFNNDYHHDAPEFLLWLIEYLNEDLNKLTINSEINKYITLNDLNISFINKLFYGEQLSITKCLNCEYDFKRTESFNHLAVDIEQNISLTYCLKKYIKKEILKNKDKYYCENCNCLQEAEK